MDAIFFRAVGRTGASHPGPMTGSTGTSKVRNDNTCPDAVQERFREEAIGVGEHQVLAQEE